ncbi:protein tyrosine phosphatase [Chryseobacterium formosense]|uniref:Protein tyrosine phosphatase n=1 Tax=Chryseobacterium formosense TaxID=236814 RepID=A0A085Z7Y9_9FLAO|nr:protein-tyrosine-phosphatase [Chryseobacterium formosense]KFF00553.1 protein tyrosine phosphatase [Chryseobacterium formosense]SFT34980.1 arsenate reductase [Chryseobacterium formosense]
MIQTISKMIESISIDSITEERKTVLQPLIDYLQNKAEANQTIRLNFICTHNSRRSHLSQIWAQTMAFHFDIKSVYCYSGGTEATAMFPKVAETLENQGFQIQMLSENANPVYAVKYAENEVPIICFSKEYSNEFNPKKEFGAIMTCNNADEGCPLVIGAEARFPIKYDDPKASDNTPEQTKVYAERSLQIATEMFYIFSQVKK